MLFRKNEVVTVLENVTIEQDYVQDLNNPTSNIISLRLGEKIKVKAYDGNAFHCETHNGTPFQVMSIFVAGYENDDENWANGDDMGLRILVQRSVKDNKPTITEGNYYTLPYECFWDNHNSKHRASDTFTPEDMVYLNELGYYADGETVVFLPGTMFKKISNVIQDNGWGWFELIHDNVDTGIRFMLVVDLDFRAVS